VEKQQVIRGKRAALALLRELYSADLQFNFNFTYRFSLEYASKVRSAI
jgi:hypothetical protein